MLISLIFFAFASTQLAESAPTTTVPSKSALENKLCKAVIDGRIDDVKKMLAAKTVSVDARLTDMPSIAMPYQVAPERYVEGGTALEVAASFNKSREMVKLLLDNGAKVDTKDTGDMGHRRTALLWAAGLNRSDIVQMLVDKKASVNETDRYGESALYKATTNNNAALVEYLVNRGANLKAIDQSGSNLLYAAAGTCNPDLVRYFLDKGQNVNVATTLDSHPICLCPQNDAISQQLLDKGANPKLNCGNFPLLIHMMKRTDSERISTKTLKRLIEKGADVNSKYVTGITPLQEAATQDIAIVQMLVQNGAKVTGDVNGWTPALRASLDQSNSTNGLAIVNLLLKNGDSFKLRTSDENNFLLVVCNYAKDMLPYAKLSIEQGKIDVNSKNKYGQTPLLLAVENTFAASAVRIETVKYLLSKGAKVNVVDDRGNTPMSAANNQPEGSQIVKLLNGANKTG